MEIAKSFFNVRTFLWIGILIALLFFFAPNLLPGSGAIFRTIYWQDTNFDKKSVNMSEIRSGGPKKDGIPSIDNPQFTTIAETTGLGDTEPVIGFSFNGEAKAYPLGILMSHEIVNDTIGGRKVAVTYCPLCNSAIVFDARVNGQDLEFGTTGNLRNSDLVMYDRQTQSWWQQFMGEAIVGEMTGTKLKMLPSRMESYARFKARFPKGLVLAPTRFGSYGSNPYVGYDTNSRPFLYSGDMPKDIAPMARLVVVGQEAWTVALLKEKRKITKGDLIITWEPGQNSALDARTIAKGREVGNVVVQRKTEKGLEDVVHDVTFAFTFHAFKPEGKIHQTWPAS